MTIKIDSKAFLKELNRLVRKFPDAELIYAVDSEGNDFHSVLFLPSSGKLDKNDQFTESTDENVNAICIN